MADAKQGKPSSLPIARIAALVEEGHSTSELAETYGVGERWLRQRLQISGFLIAPARRARRTGTATQIPDMPWLPEASCATEVGIEVHDRAIQLDSADAIADARSVCRQECPVRQQCLEWAIAADEPWGVYGGYDRTERLAIAAGENPGTFEPPKSGTCRDCETELIDVKAWRRASPGTRKVWRSHGYSSPAPGKPYCNKCDWERRSERKRLRAWAATQGITLAKAGAIPVGVWSAYRASTFDEDVAS